MSQFLLSFEQISTALGFSGLDPVPGAPLEGVGAVLLTPGDDGFRQLAAHGLLLRDSGAWRINRAFALALAVAADPDEVVWIETDRGQQRLTLARRESIATECTVRADGIVRLAFPQVWSLLDEILSVAFADDGDEPGGIAFEFRGRADEVLLLSLITDAAKSGEPCRFETLQSLVDRALADPARTLPFVRLGCGDALLDLMPPASSVRSCVLNLMAAGLVNVDSGALRPSASAASALTSNGRSADLSIRRRVFAPAGYGTIGLSAVRSGPTIVACTAEQAQNGDAVLHLRTTTRRELAGEARRLLGLARNHRPFGAAKGILENYNG